MTEPTTIARNADLQTLVQVLRDGQPRKLDVVAPVSALRAEKGDLVISGADAEISLDGVTVTDGVYQPTAICDDGLADKLGIPPGYLTRMRREHVDLYDLNVNGWLRHQSNAAKNYLVRCLRSDDTNRAVARAFLSDAYKPIDNLDVLMTILEALNEAGVPIQIHSADLSDRRMYVRVTSDQVRAMAPTLLRNYRSPFTGRSGADNPVVFAGFEVSNSEVGHGAFSIAPHAVIEVCTNGMTFRSQAVRAQHLGRKLEVGQIQWSDETQAKNLELIKSMTVDAVRSFLNADWLQRQIDKIERQSEIEVAKPEETIKVISQKLRYTEAQQDDILRMFIKGGDITTGGIMQAVTASAQNQTDADLAADMQADAMRVFELAVAANA